MAARRLARAALPLAALPLTAALVAGPAAATTPSAARTATPSATPTPGMGAAAPCSAQVLYSTGGRTPTVRPLPAPVSRTGGALLAEPGLHVTASATVAPPAPKATAWLVADLTTGQVLAACNAHVPLAPASSLKILTGLALITRIAPDGRYTARPADAQVDGTKVGLVPGSIYSTSNLWHALLMSSANDAASALATLAGGTAAATEAMRTTARGLGAVDTVPLTTSGLDVPGQVSSAYDLTVFGRALLADRRLTALVQSREYAFPKAGTLLPGDPVPAGTPPRATFQIQNHDRLLYNYPGALGVKNGWTSTTGGSFVGVAERGGRRIGVTVLAADPETWHMAAALLDWAFARTPSGADGVGRLVDGPDPAGALPTSDASTATASASASRRRANGITSPPAAVLAAGGATVLILLAGAAGALTHRSRNRSGRRA